MGYSVKELRKQFAERGVFYTDDKLAALLADIVSANGDVVDVYDPTCGAGNLLAVFGDDIKKYGQEIDGVQADVARKRLTNAIIATGNTLTEPAFTGRKFRHIVANYPFSIKWEPFVDARWADAPALQPPSKADYAFILHIISMLADDGVAAVLGFPGILYRGQREGKIREWLIRQNLIESVTLIEGGYFEDTNIATALLVIRKNRTSTDIKFCDHESGKEAVATFADVQANNFNLSPSGYIAPPVDERFANYDVVEAELQHRRNIIGIVDKALQMSQMHADLHGSLSLAPYPSITDFANDIMNVVKKYL